LERKNLMKQTLCRDGLKHLKESKQQHFAEMASNI